MFIFQGSDNSASIVYQATDDVDTSKALKVDSLPEKPNENSMYELKVDVKEELLWWEKTPGSAVISKFAFRQRMTIQEKAKLEMIDSLLEGEMLATVKAVLKDFELAEMINLEDEGIEGFKRIMVASGLFTQERADEITRLD